MYYYYLRYHRHFGGPPTIIINYPVITITTYHPRVCVSYERRSRCLHPLRHRRPSPFSFSVTSAVSRRRYDEPSTFRFGVFAKLNARVGHDNVAEETLNARVCRPTAAKLSTYDICLHTHWPLAIRFSGVAHVDNRSSRLDVAAAIERSNCVLCVWACIRRPTFGWPIMRAHTTGNGWHNVATVTQCFYYYFDPSIRDIRPTK